MKGLGLRFECQCQRGNRCGVLRVTSSIFKLLEMVSDQCRTEICETHHACVEILGLLGHLQQKKCVRFRLRIRGLQHPRSSQLRPQTLPQTLLKVKLPKVPSKPHWTCAVRRSPTCHTHVEASPPVPLQRSKT